MFDPGQQVVLHYPVDTHVDRLDFEKVTRRELQVVRVTDMLTEPLTVQQYLARPYVRRSRWRVRVWDHIRKAYRQMYLGCSREFAAPNQLRVALYEPEASKPSKLILRGFEPTFHDRDLLRRWLLKHATQVEKEFPGLTLGIYSDDLRVIRRA